MDNWEEYLQSQRSTVSADKPAEDNGSSGDYVSDGSAAATYGNTSAKKKKQVRMVRVCPKCGTEYSAHTRMCISCYERLPDPVSPEKAEETALDIRLANGSDENGIQTKDLNTTRKVGALLSIIGAAIALTQIVLSYISMSNQLAGGSQIDIDQRVSYHFLWILIYILAANILSCIFPKAAAWFVQVVPLARRHRGLYRMMHDPIDRNEALSFVSRAIIVVPIICIIIAGFIFYSFYNIYLFAIWG